VLPDEYKNLESTDDLEMGGGKDWKADPTKFGKVHHKPTPHLRRKPPVRQLIEQGTGYLTDQSMKHEVRLDWKLNKNAQKDKVFKLTIDDKVVYLELEELLYYTRIMFTK
jgi:hypothetical protein